MTDSERSQQLNALIADYLRQSENGETIDEAELLNEHPDLREELEEFFADHARMNRAMGEPPSEKPSPIPSDSSDDDTATIPPSNPALSETVTFRQGDPSIDEKATLLTGSSPAVPKVGDGIRYFGEYELLEEIARGGMGVVFKARQVKLNRLVALKMILSGQLAGEEDVKRFHIEAEAAANLDHPGIVPIYEVGEHAGQHYFSMGFVEGGSLAGRITEGPLPPQEAAAVVTRLAEAMAYAHERGVIHRDLKPANVLLAESERRDAVFFSGEPAGKYDPKVTDFGLARNQEADSQLTGTGQILGTPSYMPPEQASGNPEAMGPLCDVYSLGAILYCLLTGRPPFQAASPMETLVQLLDKEPVRPRDLNPTIPLDLETICLKCLEKKPSARYRSAGDLRQELERFQRGETITARPVGRLEKSWRWCKRNPVVAGLITAVAVVLVAGILVSTLFGLDALAQTEIAQTKTEETIQALENAYEKTREALIAKAETAKALEKAEEKRREAQAAETKAKEAQQEETRQRKLVEKREKEVHWNLHIARVFTLAALWQRGEFGRLARRLDELTPKEGEPDFRGWEWNYLQDQCEKNLVKLPVEESVNDLKWSPNGKYLASRGKSGTISLWEFDEHNQFGKPKTLSPVGRGSTPHMAWSRDSRFLAARSNSNIVVWDIEQGTDGQTFELLTTDKYRKQEISWSPDNQYIAAAMNSDCEILNLTTGKVNKLRIGRSPKQPRMVGVAWQECHDDRNQRAARSHSTDQAIRLGQTRRTLCRFDTHQRRARSAVECETAR